VFVERAVCEGIPYAVLAAEILFLQSCHIAFRFEDLPPTGNGWGRPVVRCHSGNFWL
jgi:hypothetical protein